MFKFNDEGYQARLRAAINTNLNHVEVSNLRKASILFVAILFALNSISLFLESAEVDKVNFFLSQISERVT
jgi:hypothetical protein